MINDLGLDISKVYKSNYYAIIEDGKVIETKYLDRSVYKAH